MGFCTRLAICPKLAAHTTANKFFFRYLRLELQLPSTLNGCEVGEEPHAEDNEEDKRSGGL
jgi:hypothetical protein